MPPSDEERPTPEWEAAAIDWVATSVFQLDADRIDPGKVVLRRLNREEYRWTIKELLDIDFDPAEDFPADDTGYGFDTIGETLNMSPMLLEKYFAAADRLVDEFMPYDGPKIPSRSYWMDHWKLGSIDGPKVKPQPFDKPAKQFCRIHIKEAGTYTLAMEFYLEDTDEPSGQSIDAVWRLESAGEPDGRPAADHQPRELARYDIHFGQLDKPQPFGSSVTLELPPGEAFLSLEITPKNTRRKTPQGHETNVYRLQTRRVIVEGPAESTQREYPGPAGSRLSHGPPPADATPDALRAHTRRQIATLAYSAYRRHVDEATLDRLTDLATDTAAQPGKRYEHGIGAALKAILSSPRFLFRVDHPAPGQAATAGFSTNTADDAVLIDEFSLATRMSYFLWSRNPDPRLMQLAAEGRLRENLDAEIDRMIDEPWRFPIGMDNFVGQWLQTRDLDLLDPDVRFITREARSSKADKLFPWITRQSFRRETEASFRYLFTDNRPLEEFLNADYTFLDTTLRDVYGLPKDLESVDGKPLEKYKLHRVQLPEGSHRGGILRQGSMLMVTSNPTRTSPVKRGLFLLENILGTPAPPAPADVPELEASKDAVDESAPLRKLLEVHRSNPECAGCHSRMDPLGLALENFDALGRWQDREPAVPKHRWAPWEPAPAKEIDPSGTLMTGESFANVDELADILATDRRHDFYRCLTEKMLTYALGRGLTYKDGPTVDAIVRQVEADNGQARTLIRAIIRSVPFQHMPRPQPSDSLARRE